MAGEKRRFDSKVGEVVISEKQAAFIEWLVDPRTSTEKGTQRAWAEANGLDQQTPSRWKQDVAFRRAWDRRLHSLNIDPDRIQRVIDTVYQTAIGAANNADRIKGATLYLQYINRLTPPKLREQQDEEKPIEDMTDEELAVLADNVVNLRKSKAQ